MKTPLMLKPSNFKFLRIRINYDDEIYKTDTAVRYCRLIDLKYFRLTVSMAPTQY